MPVRDISHLDKPMYQALRRLDALGTWDPQIWQKGSSPEGSITVTLGLWFQKGVCIQMSCLSVINKYYRKIEKIDR